MHYSYDRLSVSQVADLLDTETTYVYKLIREGAIKPYSKNPLIIIRAEVHKYLQARLPKQFMPTWKNAPKKEVNSWT